LTTSGQLDASFGEAGWGIVRGVGPGDDNARSVLVDGTGRTVVVGSAYTGSDDDVVVLRFTTDGDPDPAFGTDGRVLVDFGGRNDRALVGGHLADGRIVVAALSTIDGGSAYAAARLNDDGTFDPTYDGDGRVLLTFQSGFDYPQVAFVLPDGGLLFAGQTFSVSPGVVPVVRLDANGALDSTFDGDGRTTIDVALFDEAGGVAAQTDGKVIVVAHGDLGGANPLATFIFRLNADGSPDPSFGGDGRVSFPASSTHVYSLGVAVQSDGKILALASRPASAMPVVVARLLIDGTPDPAYDGDGLVEASGNANSITVDAASRIVIAGGTANHDFLVRRFTETGAPDGSFGTDGGASIDFGGIESGLSVAVSGERLTVAGNTFTVLGTDFAVARLFAEPGTGAGPTAPLIRFEVRVSPNPIVDDLNVELTLEHEADVRVVIFDLLGREVAVLHSGPLTAGGYGYQFDAATLPSAVYVVRVEANGHAVSRVLSVLR